MKTRIASHCGASLAFVIFASHALANPVGGTVVGGNANATITGQGTALTTINQTANRAIINWQDFSIAAGEMTRFVQPSATASVLNRVLSGNPTEIYGSLTANGRVFVINPNGILVGAGGVVDTKGFVASTLDIPDSSFLSGGSLVFAGNSTAPVRNDGTIQGLGGDVFLIAHSVENFGTIRAPDGTVGLAAGSQVQLVQSGAEHLSVLAGNPAAPAATGVNNLGAVEAASAELKAAGGNIYALAINNGGVVRANGIVRKNGRIYLGVTGGNIQNSGTLAANNADGSGGTITLDGGHNSATPSTVVNSGTIEARGDTAGTRGGTVALLGDRVGLLGNASVDVSGDAGGGTALVGGDYHGDNPAVQNAEVTYVGSSAQIKANAGSVGNGGKVVVWSDDRTVFEGDISARAGSQGGNGGFVEVSGKNQLGFNGTVDLSAPGGKSGTLLLDPATFTVQASNPDLNGDGTAGDDIATLADLSNPANFPGLDSIITAGAVNALLTANNTLILAATVSGTINADITGAGNANLTLNAPTLNLNAKITLAGLGVLSGNATTVNVGTGGGIQNGIDAVSAGGLVNIASGAYAESVNIGKNLSLTVPAGTATANSWASAPAATLTLSGNFSSSAGMNFQGPVLLGANTLLSDTAAGNIAFGSTLNGAHTLQINTDGTTTFGGLVGNSAALTSLTTDAAGGTAINEDVTTTGGQTYNDAVTLGGAAATRTLAGVNVNLANTVAGAGKNLTVNDSGTTTFGGAVSAVNTLTTDAAGTTAINANITTTAGQTYNDAVTLGGGGTTRTLAGVNVNLAGTVAGAGKNLTVTDSGTTTFGNTVTAVNTLTTDAAGATAINGDITTTADQIYNDTVTLGGAGATRTLTGVNVNLINTLTGAGKNLTVNASGTTTFGNTVSGVNALTTDAAGSTVLNVDITTTAGQTYNDPVTFGGAAVTRILSGVNVILGNTVGGGGKNLTVNDSGTTTFGGSVSAVNTLLTDAAGSTAINADIATSSGQTYNDSVVTADGVTLSGTVVQFNNKLSPGGDASAANLTVDANLTFGAASTLYVTLNGTGAGSSYDQIDVPGTPAKNINITAGAALTGEAGVAFTVGNTLKIINNSGNTDVSGTFTPDPVVSIGGQSFDVRYNQGNTDVDLRRAITDWVWDGGAGNNNWSSQNNWVGNNGHPGTGDSVIFAGNVRLTPNNDLDNLILNLLSFQAGSGAFILGGNAISLTGGVANNSVTLQTINMPVTLAASQAFGAISGPLAFGGTVQGGFALTLNGPSAITLSGAVGGGGNALTELIANTALTLGSSVNTVNAQTYNSAVTLSGNSTMTTSGGALVTFASTVNGTAPGAQDLTVNGGVSLGGAIGGATALGAFQINSPGDVAINQNVTANSVAVRSGTDGSGNTTFGAVTVRADAQSYRAGDGTGGAGTTAIVNLAGGNPAFRNTAGLATPASFTFRQDGAIAAVNFPAAAQFGGTLPASLVLQSDDGGVTLPGLTLASDLQVIAAGAIAQSGALNLGGLGSFTSTGAGAAGNITLNDGGNNFGSLTLSSANGTAVSVSEASDTTLNSVAVNNGALTINSGGIISQGAGQTITVGGLASFTSTGAGLAGNIALNNAGNNFGSLGLSSAAGADVSVIEASATALDTVSVNPGGGGTLEVTSAGNITQVAGRTITAGGAATFTAPSGNSINLGNAGNTFNGPVTFVGNGGNLQDVTVRDTTAFDLQALTVGGILNVTAGGAISQSGALNVGGLASFTSTGAGANGDITLNLAGNNFGSLGLSSAGGSAVSVIEASATALDNVSVNPAGGGTLAVNSAGNITQVAGKTVVAGGTAVFTAPVGGTINLGNTGNNFNSPVSFVGNGGNLQNVTVTDSTDFDIAGITLDGLLNITAGGPITQSGAIVVDTLQLGGLGPVTLDNPLNQVNTIGASLTGAGRTFSFTDQVTLAKPVLNVTGISTANGGITLTADAMNITGPINSGSANTILQPLTPASDINLGSPEVAGRLSLTQNELNNVTASTLQIGNTSVGTIFGKNDINTALIPVGTLLFVDHTTTTEASSQAFAQLLAGAILPVPKVNVTSFSSVSIDAESAAKILPPGCIGVLFLQVPFPADEEAVYKIEDISKWTSGRVAFAGATSGPQTAR